MYRVLIVDDEPEIRHGLRLKVDWESLDLAVVGEAGNGLEALELLQAQAVDILITDMNMPVMGGAALLEACREQHPHLRLVVLTGYEDFQYAKAAIRNQAKEYLLKPVARDELVEVLAKIKRELDGERTDQDEQAAIRWRLTQYYKEMKEHFLLHLAKGEAGGTREAGERARLFELEVWGEEPVRFVTAGLRERSPAAGGPASPAGSAGTADQGAIAALAAPVPPAGSARSASPPTPAATPAPVSPAAGSAADSPSPAGAAGNRTPEKLRLPFELIGREFAAGYREPVQVFRDPQYPGLLHAVLRERSGPAAAFVAELRDCVRTQLGYEPAVTVGQPVTGFADWKDGYLSSLLAWHVTETRLKATAAEAGETKSGLADETVKMLERCLARGERDAFARTVRAELAEAFGLSQIQFVKRIFHLSILLDKLHHPMHPREEDGGQLWLRPDLALGLDTVDKAADFLIRQAERAGLGRKDEAADPETAALRAACSYIDENYMYDLNLTELAERFNYHPTYFSERFKAKIGRSFIQYLTDVRMAHAVRLLADTALNLWDIAELTGFSNASYFSSKFKKVYGVTPSEYRQRASEKIDTELPKK
ncbi:response regulator transcription factor [Gorillibacterium sp. sgz5001074]|uniref:response regulator transcription factor n=1 Tax=Gorillibacterium sp. sgz5001074 TaxID=3446695 RepID=UPI003F66DAA3